MSKLRMASSDSYFKLLCLHGERNATISSIKCPQDHNMSTALVTPASLWRLCGFRASPGSRYLDDQVRDDFLERSQLSNT